MAIRPRTLVPLVALVTLVACGSDEDPPEAQGGGARAGAAGAAGKSGGAGKAGSGGAGQSGGQGGAGQGGAGQAGSAGSAGGAAGAAGLAGAGQGGQAGAGAAGAAGGAGQGGAGAGGAGQGGSGQGGAGGSLAGGAAGAASCEPGCKGVCVAGECCTLERICGGACCEQGQVCSFEKCIAPGKECQSAEDCGADEYCDPRYGDQKELCPGVTASTGKCLPRPPVCPGGDPPAPEQPVTCVGKCEVAPGAGVFDLELKYQWGGVTTPPYDTDVMVTPVVIQLDDDNCDGKIDARDRPEIAFTAYKNQVYFGEASLVVTTIEGGKVVERWRAEHVYMDGQLAAGNVDGAPGNEIIACNLDGTLTAYKGESGEVLWKTPATVCAMPAIADLDGDGSPEAITEGGIYNGKDGTLKHSYSAPMQGSFTVADLDGDGQPDIVGTSQAFHADGKLFADTGAFGYTYPNIRTIPSGPAVADLDGDGKPEVIGAFFNQHQITLWRHDPGSPSGAAQVRPPFDLNGPLSPAQCPGGSNGNLHGGGPVTVGDFNGDGAPDVALAGGVGYAVLDGKKLMNAAVAAADTFLWAKQTQDCSSAGTGSSLFDFNGDGKAEVVYADENRLRIYEGATGDILYETCNTSGTLAENPVIADVDGDDQADIVVVSNAFGAAFGAAYQCPDGSMTSGVRIFGSKNGDWVRTRRVWNQHSYHVTNVNDDGSIPKVEADNWKQPGLNNFRQNKQPGGELSAPDAVVSLLAPRCNDGPFALVATVRNVGEAPLPAGVVVGFYEGEFPSGKPLGSAKTKQTLYPAQGEDVSLEVPGGGVAISQGDAKVYAVAADGAPINECRADNNRSASQLAACGKL